MGEEKTGRGARLLIFPYPIQGHINPMIQLSKRLSSKGLNVTLIIASNKQFVPYTAQYSITITSIFNGFKDDDPPLALISNVDHFTTSASQSLSEFIESEKLSDNPPKALIFDPFMPWALDVATDHGLYGVGYFTQSWSVNLIYYHIKEGSYDVPHSQHEHPTLSSFPSFPMLSPNDMPSFAVEYGSYPHLFNLVVNQFSTFRRADCILCNTFDKLEDKIMEWLDNQYWPVKNIGPMIPWKFLDNRFPDDKDYGLGNFKTKSDENAVKWLDTKPPSSVVYVSYGTLAALDAKQMKEIALALRDSRYLFLWSVRESERSKLPNGFLEEVWEKEYGLLVNWIDQLQVLTHKSVGCFITHCGWNSTLETLCLGVPLVGMPQWTDQPTNAKFIEDIWKVGIRVKAEEDGFVKKEEIVRSLKEVMEGEKGKEMKRNAENWKLLAEEAIREGGSSDRNLEDFVTEIEPLN